MKYYILFLLSLLNISAIAQSSQLPSPMGTIISISPGTTITQASPATQFYTEVIRANSLMPNRYYRIRMSFQLTTPLISIPGISVTFQLGSQTFNLMSNSALVGGVTNGLFVIEANLIATGASTQRIEAVITQPNGSLITLGSGITPVGSFTANSAIDNNFSVTIQFTGLNLGTASLNNYWILRDPFQ